MNTFLNGHYFSSGKGKFWEFPEKDSCSSKYEPEYSSASLDGLLTYKYINKDFRLHIVKKYKLKKRRNLVPGNTA